MEVDLALVDLVLPGLNGVQTVTPQRRRFTSENGR
jgi:hypothetical protein